MVYFVHSKTENSRNDRNSSKNHYITIYEKYNTYEGGRMEYFFKLAAVDKKHGFYGKIIKINIMLLNNISCDSCCG